VVVSPAIDQRCFLLFSDPWLATAAPPLLPPASSPPGAFVLCFVASVSLSCTWLYSTHWVWRLRLGLHTQHAGLVGSPPMQLHNSLLDPVSSTGFAYSPTKRQERERTF
jgi:hypothetical protein